MWMAPPPAGLVLAAPRSAGSEALACVQGPIEVLDCTVAGAGTLEIGQEAPMAPSDGSKVAKSLPLARNEAAATPVTFNFAVVSDYRRAGVSKSANGPAVQGGVDVNFPAHWNAGARASTIAEHGNVEIVLYGAKSFEVDETELSLGASMLAYPRAPRSDYAFVQASASRAIGPIDATVAVSYAPNQGNLDHRDNLYLVARARTPIGDLFGFPVTLAASIGRMRGRFAMAHVRSDWSLGVSSRIRGVDVGVTYVDNDLSTSRGDPTAVLSLARSF
jgi:uncharacterized protein (TIGR02001 family)